MRQCAAGGDARGAAQQNVVVGRSKTFPECRLSHRSKVLGLTRAFFCMYVCCLGPLTFKFNFLNARGRHICCLASRARLALEISHLRLLLTCDGHSGSAVTWL